MPDWDKILDPFSNKFKIESGDKSIELVYVNNQILITVYSGNRWIPTTINKIDPECVKMAIRACIKRLEE